MYKKKSHYSIDGKKSICGLKKGFTLSDNPACTICARVLSNGYAEDHPLYSTWEGIRNRTFLKSKVKYKGYGARGIKMCDRWASNFWNFVEDIGMKPSPQHSVERINNDGDYEPSNCKWATKSEQNMNKSKRIGTYSKHRFIYFHKKWNKWWVANPENNKLIAKFNTELEAIEAKKKLALKYPLLNK